MAQLVASISGVVLGGVVEVVGRNLARDEIFTASIGSVDSLYLSVFIYSVNLHHFLILCSSKAMIFVKLYFHTSYIYLISLVSLIRSIRLSFANEIDPTNILLRLSKPEFYGDLVYKLKKIVATYISSAQFIKIMSHYKHIGYYHLCIATDCMLDGHPNHGWQLCFPL